jgi:5'-methylthioadenosine phosphorylase
VLVDDVYAPAATTPFYDDERSHVVPACDGEWRATVLAAWQATTSTPIVDGGVYAQTRGPRFETPAEVRALTRVADLVGMTVASEMLLCSEAGLPYAAIAVVDNLANGLGETPLSIEEFAAGVAANRDRLVADLDALLPALAGPT